MECSGLVARRGRILALSVVACTLLPPALTASQALLVPAAETAFGQRVESALFLSAVETTMLPPAPSVPRGMAPPGVMETASGQVDSAY